MSSFLIFARGGLHFAVNLEHLRRICSEREIRPLPAPSSGVLGVVSDGSHIVPVIEGPLPTMRPVAHARVLLMNNGESPFGFLVESLEGPARLVKHGAEDFDPLTLGPAMTEVPVEAMSGVYRVLSSAGSITSADPVVLVVPGPLYRARSAGEDE